MEALWRLTVERCRASCIPFTVQTQEFDQLAFDGKLLKLRNIIAQTNPAAPKRIALAAHWDTRPRAENDAEFDKLPARPALPARKRKPRSSFV